MVVNSAQQYGLSRHKSSICANKSNSRSTWISMTKKLTRNALCLRHHRQNALLIILRQWNPKWQPFHYMMHLNWVMSHQRHDLSNHRWFDCFGFCKLAKNQNSVSLFFSCVYRSLTCRLPHYKGPAMKTDLSCTDVIMSPGPGYLHEKVG